MPSFLSKAEDKPIVAIFSGPAGSLTILENVTDVHHREHSETEPLESGHERKYKIEVFTFGPSSQQGVRLVLKKGNWTLVTPFGQLEYPDVTFTSCILHEIEENLVFIARQLTGISS